MGVNNQLKNVKRMVYSYLKEVLDSFSDYGNFAMLSPGLLFLLLFFFLPMIILLSISFQTQFVAGSISGFTFGNYVEVLSDSYFIRTLGRTLLLGVAVAVTTLTLGYPVAYQITRTRSNWKRLSLLLIILIPYLTSVVVRTFGWLIILLENGLLNTLIRWIGITEGGLDLVNNVFGIYIGLVHVFLPISVITLMTSLGKIDNEYEAAARDLGASRIKVVTQILLPLSRQGILSGFLLVFALSVASYTTPSILGGTTSVMATSIYTYVGSLTNFPIASTLAIVLLVFAMITMIISNRVGSEGGDSV